MSTQYPTDLDSLTNPTASDELDNPNHADQHSNLNDAMEAVQTKVGIDGSADTDSVDYKIATNTTSITTNATAIGLNTTHRGVTTGNPHSVSKSDVGLGNVDNTSDATKNSASATLTNKTIAGADNTVSGITPGMWTNPYCFHAHLSANQTGIADVVETTVNFNSVTGYADGDPNGDFNTTTHAYVVPVDGFYWFQTHLMTTSVVESDFVAYIRRVSTSYQVGRARPSSPYQSSIVASGGILLKCLEGESIYVRTYINNTSTTSTIRGGAGSGDDATFTGFLVHAT